MAIPNFDEAKKLYQMAVAHYRAAQRSGEERKQMVHEQESRAPITIADIELIWVAPGHFYMGSENGSVEEETSCDVCGSG